MSSPSSRAKPAKPGRRPGAGNHASTDWISRLHKRHDARRHPEPHEDERPLLADEHPDEDSHTEAQTEPARKDRLKPARDCVTKTGEIVKHGLSKIKDGASTAARATLNGAKKAGIATSKGVKKAGQAVRNNPKTILGAVIGLLSASTGSIGFAYRNHLIQDKMLCTTPACIDAAFTILHNLHPSVALQTKVVDTLDVETLGVDPCSNFDQYVCGGFGQNHNLRTDQSDLSTSTLIAENVDNTLRRVLEQPVSNVSIKDRAIFQKFKADYTACMDQETLADLGLKPLESVVEQVKKLLPDHDPVMPKPLPPQLSIVKPTEEKGLLTDVMIYLAKIGVKALIAFDIGADNKVPKGQALFAAPVLNIGLPAKEFYDDQDVVKEYERVMRNTLTRFFDTKVNASRFLHHLPRATVKPADLAHWIVHFETQLARVVPPLDRLNGISKAYNKMKVSTFDQVLPQMSLESFIASLAPMDYKADSIIVADPNYLEHISYLTQRTPREVLRAYFVWKVIQRYVDRVHDGSLKDLNDFNQKMKGTQRQYPAERWRRCIRHANEDLGWITSKFYLDSHYSISSKTAATLLLKKLKDSFAEIVLHAKWMSSAERIQAVEHILSVTQKVGHPKNYPNVKNSTALEEFYEHVSIRNNTYLSNRVEAAKFESHRAWSKLGKKFNSDQWDLTATAVNAKYNPFGNEAVFPAAMLQAPVFYDASVPQYLSYGSLGAIGGHEMFHAFEASRSRFNEEGKYVDWWSKSTRDAFHARSLCFAKQYSKYSAGGPTGSQHVNGNTTLQENLADASGADIAFQAWRKLESKKPGPHLPGLQQFSSAQLFWLSFGNVWCSKAAKETAIHRLYSDIHAPKPIRILGTVANSRDFLEAFHCPLKKPMCELW